MKPKEIFADSVASSHSTILIGELAKILKANGFETGQKRLFETLRQDGFLIKRKGSDYFFADFDTKRYNLSRKIKREESKNARL